MSKAFLFGTGGGSSAPSGDVQASKTVNLTSEQSTILPDSPYTSMGQVITNIQIDGQNTFTPSTSDQTKYPQSGKFFNQVKIKAIHADTLVAKSKSSTYYESPENYRDPETGTRYDSFKGVWVLPPDLDHRWDGEISTLPGKITENGTYTPLANHFFNKVIVNVPQTGGEVETQEKSGKSKDESYEVVPDTETGHRYLLSKVTINPPDMDEVNETTITQNGVIEAADDKFIKKLTINVPSSGGGNPEPSKEVTITSTSQTISPATGYDSMLEVVAKIDIDNNNEFTPSNLDNTYYPESGKFFNQVKVKRTYNRPAVTTNPEDNDVFVLPGTDSSGKTYNGLSSVIVKSPSLDSRYNYDSSASTPVVIQENGVYEAASNKFIKKIKINVPQERVYVFS